MLIDIKTIDDEIVNLTVTETSDWVQDWHKFQKLNIGMLNLITNNKGQTVSMMICFLNKNGKKNVLTRQNFV